MDFKGCVVTIGSGKDKKYIGVIEEPLVKLRQCDKKSENDEETKKCDEVVNDKKEVCVMGRIFKYKGKDIDIKFDEHNEPWFKGRDIARLLTYKNAEYAIRTNVSVKNKKTLNEFRSLNPQKKCGLRGNEKSAIYINQAGVFSLLLKSSKKEAKEFQDWVSDDVLVSINKTGKYDPIGDKIKTSFFSDNFMWQFEGKRVVYLGYVGIDEETGKIIYKYGITRDAVRRDFEELSKIFEDYRMIYVRECIENDVVEKLIKKELKFRKLLAPKKVKGKLYTELFVTNDDFDIEKVKKMVDTIIDNKSATINEIPEKYIYLAETEKTKQESEKTKQESEKTKQLSMLKDILSQKCMEDPQMVKRIITRFCSDDKVGVQ
jgi:prophage antirepressor-like protein